MDVQLVIVGMRSAHDIQPSIHSFIHPSACPSQHLIPSLTPSLPTFSLYFPPSLVQFLAFINHVFESRLYDAGLSASFTDDIARKMARRIPPIPHFRI